MQMLIPDFFSHKIHASEDLWADQLCSFAHIFAQYDNQEYRRDELASEFGGSARRWSPKRQDAYYRDVVTAYPTFLGICHFLYENDRWIVRMTETAKKFLLGEAPDTAAFLRLQLPLLQHPLISSGIMHNSSGPRVQGATRLAKERLLHAGAVVSPVRLLVAALSADCLLRNSGDIFTAAVAYDEWYALANDQSLFKTVCPETSAVAAVLGTIRKSNLQKQGEHRFNLLEQTEMFQLQSRKIMLRSPSSDAERSVLSEQFDAIGSIHSKFDFVEDDLSSPEALARWADYFDAIKILPPTITDCLGGLSSSWQPVHTTTATQQKVALSAPLRKFDGQTRPYTSTTENSQDISGSSKTSNPELTRIKQERRNMIHGSMVDRLCAWLEDNIKAEVGDSAHIDLWASLPDGRNVIFEIKSGGPSMHEQLRKGLSQLYEYRYRYRDALSAPSLYLVLPEELPHEWLSDYLCTDREINICFLRNSQTEPEFHRLCPNPVRP